MLKGTGFNGGVKLIQILSSQPTKGGGEEGGGRGKGDKGLYQQLNPHNLGGICIVYVYTNKLLNTNII